MTENVQEVELPELSTATHVTRFVPPGKIEPLGGWQLTVALPQT